MVASISRVREETAAVEQLPDPLADGSEPEGRVIVCGISWKRYLSFDLALGDDRPSPRFYYLDGELEIMTTSNEHERIRNRTGDLLSDYFFETGVEIFTRGQATIRVALERAGAEPDESWCIGTEKQFPDLVLEVALTSGGISKLEVYRRFKIPEVWFWRRKRLEIFGLDKSGDYVALPKSGLLQISMSSFCSVA